MRGQQAFRIEGYDKQIIVYELTMKQIMHLFNLKDLPDTGSWSDILKFLQDQILSSATNLTFDELLEFTPRELEVIWTKLREANKVFFGLIRTPALKQVAEKVVPNLIGEFGNSLSGLFKLDMLTRKTTDTPTS